MAADDIIKKIEDLLNSSTKLSGATRQNFKDQLDLLIQQNAELSRFQALMDSIGDSTDAVRDDLTYIYSSLKDSLNELRQQNVYLNAQKSALNKLADIAKNTLSIRRGETELDTKKLAKLKLETTEKIRLLEFSKKQHDATTEEGQAALEAIDDQIKSANLLYNAFDEILKTNKEFNKSLGLAPQIAAGIDKALSKIGLPPLGIANAIAETRMLHQAATGTGQEISIWGTFSGKVKDNFTSIFTKANLIQGSIGFLIEALSSSDKAAGQLAKDFNITYDEANQVREQLTQIGNLSGEIAVNTRALQESMVAVGKTLGSNAILNEKDLVTFTKLREMAGLQNEELAAMEKLTLATGGNLEDNVKNLMYSAKIIGLNNKVLLNEKDIMRDVANASDAIKLSLAGNPEALGKAAAQAKALGMSLEQVDRIAESLLDFESSISNELSAELITGKDLNLEQARLYALNNDMAGLAREIAKNYGSAAEFSKMNRLQQEYAAKAVGMSREELAKTLIDQEALHKMSSQDPELAKKTLEFARQKGMTDEEISKLKEKDFDNLMKQQSMQERLNNSIEKMKELFVSIAEPILNILSPLVDLLNDILPPIMKLLEPILGMIRSTFDAIAGVIKLITLDFSGAAKSFKSIAPDFVSGFKGWGIGTEAEKPKFADGGIVTKPITNATVGEAGSEAIIPLDSPAGKRMLTGGTNPGSTNAYVDLSPLLEEMRALRQEQARANAKPTIVENSVNGTKFGTAIAVNAYKVQ